MGQKAGRETPDNRRMMAAARSGTGVDAVVVGAGLGARAVRVAPGSFGSWLGRDLPESHLLHRMARAMCEFALSLPVGGVSYREARAVLWRTWREGLPGVPEGGCRAVIEALVTLIG